MEDATINKPHFFIKQITEIGVTTLISAYFFTAGYINSFSLPIRVDFFQSGYFLIVLLADSVPTLLFNTFTVILKLPIYIFLFLKNLLFNFYTIYIIFQHIIENRIFLIILTAIIVIILIVFFIKLKFSNLLKKIIFPVLFFWRKIKLMSFSSKFLIFYILYITFMKIIFDNKGLKLFTNTFGKIQKELGFCKHFSGTWEQKQSCIKASSFLYDLEFYINNVINVVFILSLLFITFSIPIFIQLNFRTNGSLKLSSKKVVPLLLVTLLSISSSYYLGRVYLGKFIDYPVYRSDITKTTQRIQIWKDKNDYFYIECKENSNSIIKGINTQTDKIFYNRHLDELIHPNICSRSKKKKNTVLRDKELYKNCYYKNDKSEILIAHSCVALSDYTVVNPKTLLSACYIHTSQLVKFSKHEKAPKRKYYLTSEDIKKYENNYKHTPLRKRKNPLSNPGFSIEHYPWKFPKGSHKIVISFSGEIEIIEFTYSKNFFNSKTEMTSYPLKDIKKHFPKCD